jgi:peptide/nickel transport system permease protein
MRWLKGLWSELRQLPRSAWIPVALFLFIGVFAPWLAPKDPVAQNLLNASQGFSAEHLGVIP